MDYVPVVVLEESVRIKNSHHSAEEIFDFEIDVLGEPVHFQISVERKQAKLTDIVPTARAIAEKLSLAMVDKLRRNGTIVTCHKGCSSCCNYLVPLSVPEAFCLREEILAMPEEQARATMQLFLNSAIRILDSKFQESDLNELIHTNTPVQTDNLSEWYAGLNLTCPFLSDGICTSYEQRPIACREHLVTGSALLCEAHRVNEPKVVKMPVNILECVCRLTAELEQSEIEAVMMPLALPWAQENLGRSERTWPAVTIVKHFVAIIKKATLELNYQP
jgi:Fe-S-cluster containining protein